MNLSITVQDAINQLGAINEFVKKDIPLSAELAWNLDENAENIKSVVVRFEKLRNEVLSSLCENNAIEPIEGTDSYRAAKGHEEEFNAALNQINEYLNHEVSFDIKTVTKNDVPAKLSLNDLRALKFMIADA